MKKVAILLLSIVLISSVFLYIKGKPKNVQEETSILPASTTSEDNIDTNLFDLEFNNQILSVDWFKVDDTEKLILIPNFDNKQTSDEVLVNHQCKKLVSGGFYSEENTPIGLFVSNYKEINSQENNSLFNGFLSVNDFETPRISKILPNDRLRIALQSGPILKENSFTQKLLIKNDAPDRRIVAAISGDNNLYFLAIYENASVFLGPYLKDLPEILTIIEENTGEIFADAINLDGGTHSVFINDSKKLSEYSPAGSFFCHK